MCLGLFLRIILFFTDLGIKIIGDEPAGVYSFKSAALLFCKNVFVYMANCCFYFSFFAIGCDWIELCFAFKMLLKASPPEEFDPMRTRVKNFFVWFLIVFLVLLVLLLLSSVLTYSVNVTENNWIAFIALVCLTISQIILIFMFVWLFISVLKVTLAIRKRQKEEREISMMMQNNSLMQSTKSDFSLRNTDPGVVSRDSKNLLLSLDFGSGLMDKADIDL